MGFRFSGLAFTRQGFRVSVILQKQKNKQDVVGPITSLRMALLWDDRAETF